MHIPQYRLQLMNYVQYGILLDIAIYTNSNELGWSPGPRVPPVAAGGGTLKEGPGGCKDAHETIYFSTARGTEFRGSPKYTLDMF